MPKAAKIYATGIIVLGCAAMVVALSRWGSVDPGPLAIYLAATLIASVVKFPLPGIQGTHSACALFILFGVAHFSAPEVMLAGLASAVVGSLWTAKKRPTLLQVAFNAANVCLAVGACCVVASMVFGGAASRPAVMALLAALYFAINTIIVSGILSLLQGKGLASVWEAWYLDWFPYYIAGAALAGLLGKGGHPLDPQAWLVLPPLLYLIHFYAGLSQRQNNTDVSGGAKQAPFNPGLSWSYLGIVIALGGAALGYALLHWHTDNGARFFGFLVAAVALATWKVRLPAMNGALSVNFVIALVAITELSLSETVLISAVGALVQSMWKPKVQPKLVQVLFNISCQVVASSLAFYICRTWLQVDPGQSLVASVTMATAIMYAAVSLMVAGALHLVENQPLQAIWRNCFYWSFPYFLVGTVASGLMLITTRTLGWQSSLLVLPALAMVYVSYRLHLRQSGSASTPAAA